MFLYWLIFRHFLFTVANGGFQSFTDWLFLVLCNSSGSEWARETATSLHAPFTWNAVPMTMNRIFETLLFPLILFYNDSLWWSLFLCHFLLVFILLPIQLHSVHFLFPLSVLHDTPLCIDQNLQWMVSCDYISTPITSNIFKISIWVLLITVYQFL